MNASNRCLSDIIITLNKPKYNKNLKLKLYNKPSTTPRLRLNLAVQISKYRSTALIVRRPRVSNDSFRSLHICLNHPSPWCRRKLTAIFSESKFKPKINFVLMNHQLTKVQKTSRTKEYSLQVLVRKEVQAAH